MNFIKRRRWSILIKQERHIHLDKERIRRWKLQKKLPDTFPTLRLEWQRNSALLLPWRPEKFHQLQCKMENNWTECIFKKSCWIWDEKSFLKFFFFPEWIQLQSYLSFSVSQPESLMKDRLMSLIFLPSLASCSLSLLQDHSSHQTAVPP